MGTQVAVSAACPPQMDGQTEHIIRTFEDMSRVCTLDFKGSWDEHLWFIEIAYNKSIKRHLTKLYVKENIDHQLDGLQLMKFALLGSGFVHQAIERVKVI